MANGWSIWVGLIVVAVFCGLSYFLAPKGETQTIWRSTLILSAVSCYLMWAITFFAQWHPLIVPVRNDMRTDVHQGKLV